MAFTEKYRPRKTKDVIGHEKEISEIKDKVANYSKKRKALLIYGPTGTGKTSAIHALADELDLEIIEVNASDVRSSSALEEKVLPAIRQQSLFSKGKIILIDEIDGLSGTEDRGGASTIAKFIEESTFPIILTANDISDSKLSPIKKVSSAIEFKSLSALETAAQLKRIAQHEKIDIDEESIVHLARTAGGDLRSALNDLEILSVGKGKVTKKDIDDISERGREESINSALLKIFKTTNPDVALPAFDNVDEDIDKLFLWIDENLPKEYKKAQELANAYDALSLADVYFGRIRRWQYYRYYVYIYNLLTAGIALAKKEKNPESISYTPTSRILKIWMANQRNAKKKAIAAKIAEKTHASTRRLMRDMPYIRAMYKHSKKKEQERIAEEFKLEDEEIEWLRK